MRRHLRSVHKNREPNVYMWLTQGTWILQCDIQVVSGEAARNAGGSRLQKHITLAHLRSCVFEQNRDCSQSMSSTKKFACNIREQFCLYWVDCNGLRIDESLNRVDLTFNDFSVLKCTHLSALYFHIVWWQNWSNVSVKCVHLRISEHADRQIGVNTIILSHLAIKTL